MTELKKLHVKTGDTVVVITGKDDKSKGKVLKAIPKTGRVVVEGVNMISRHTKPRKTNEQGGIIKKEAPIDASNVMLYCPVCKAPHKASILVNEKKEHIRVCKKCKESFDK